MSSCSVTERVASSFLRAEVLRRSQNNRECWWGAWGHVGGSLYVFFLCMHEIVCVFVCVSVSWCTCLFVTHTMQQDHTALLVCGISRFKIGPTVGGGQEQTAERGGRRRRRRRGEKGRRTGTTHMSVFTATDAERCFLFSSECYVRPTHLSASVGKFLRFAEIGGVTV